jgi:histidinol dehydrogenase
MIDIRRLDSRQPDFDARFEALLQRSAERNAEVRERVAGIVAGVRARGDDAVLEYTRQYDQLSASSVAELEVDAQALRAAWEVQPADLQAALQAAHARIRDYAGRQGLQGFEYLDAHGNRLGQRVTALDRVGVYVPGGKAAYPSSVLMNAVPAVVAGVAEIVMVVPAPAGELNPVVLAAAHLTGVHRVFKLGGAQAIAALAYGTATVPAVDKIVGPGNAYVAEAKRQVFGQVGIDAIAGPSEIAVICDGATDPRWIAMDLFSQAEHDEDAQAILLSPDTAFLDAVLAAMTERLAELPRADTVRAALRAHGALILTCDLTEAATLANRIAAEHLELSVADPEALLPLVRHAGALFLGRHTPEAFGDYCAGPNHVLPTSRAARYASPLGTYEFQKRSSVISCTADGARALSEVAGRLADAEGLQAHAASARDRR